MLLHFGKSERTLFRKWPDSSVLCKLHERRSVLIRYKKIIPNLGMSIKKGAKNDHSTCTSRIRVHFHPTYSVLKLVALSREYICLVRKRAQCFLGKDIINTRGRFKEMGKDRGGICLASPADFVN